MRTWLTFLVLFAASTAQGAIDPITGFDTTSGQDVAFRSRGLSLSSHTAEITMRAQYVAIDGPNQFVLRPGFGFGITSSFELAAEVLVRMEPDSHTYVAPRFVFDVVDTKAVDVALTGFVLIDLNGNGNALPLRQFGTPVRIKLLDTLTLFTGNNLVSWVHTGGGDDIIDLNINVGLGWQLHNDLALRFDTQIAAINLIGPGGSTSLSDVFPIGFGLVYAIASHVDLTAGATYYSVNGGGDWLLVEGGLLARF